MKLFSAKYLALMLLVCAYVGSMKADYANGDDYGRSNYECGCCPLNECSWGLQVDAGVRPILWRNRGDFLTVNCLATTVINDLGQLPKFSKLFRVPWQVGGQVGYAFSCNTFVYAEFNYAQSRLKCDDFVRIGTSSLVLSLDKYKLYEAYVGARYYWGRWWCDRVAFFLGGKIGFIHHKGVSTGSFTNTSDGSGVIPVNDFFRKQTRVAGGGNIGLDILLCGNWSFVITAEVVATCGPTGVNALALSTIDSTMLNSAGALFIPGVSTELAFPVTFGIRYNF